MEKNTENTQNTEAEVKENAPAPENPVVIWQYGLHETHLCVFDFGHALFSIGLPFSIMVICLFDPFFISSSAVNIPAGPAPIITTSFFMGSVCLSVFFANSYYIT